MKQDTSASDVQPKRDGASPCPLSLSCLLLSRYGLLASAFVPCSHCSRWSSNVSLSMPRSSFGYESLCVHASVGSSSVINTKSESRSLYVSIPISVWVHHLCDIFLYTCLCLSISLSLFISLYLSLFGFRPRSWFVSIEIFPLSLCMGLGKDIILLHTCIEI